MATKKGGKKAAKKGGTKKAAKKAAEPRKPQRRDNPNQQVTASTFHRRTQTSEADEALQKKRRDLQAKLVVSFCFLWSYRTIRPILPHAFCRARRT